MIRIGDILQQAGLVTESDIAIAIEQQKATGKFLGKILIDSGKLSETDLLRCLSTQMKIRFVSLKDIKMMPEAIQKMPIKYAHHYKVFPVQYDQGRNVLVVAISDPLNMWPIEDMKLHLRLDIEPILATSTEIEEAIHQYYGVGANTIEKIIEKDEDRIKATTATTTKGSDDIEKLASQASVIRLVNEIIAEAIEGRATDVHFERYENDLVVRFRVDGILQPAKISDDIKFLYSAIVARLKVISNLDIVERRIPQSGSTHIRMGNRDYDLRISIIPDHYGEGVVIRILPSEMLIDLTRLGVPDQNLEQIKGFLNHSNGLIYVTGPTGSGKTTTLYAALSYLNKPSVKIITVEDPVEYKMRGVEQVQVNSKINLTFASVLRSVLRHDPDIIMVGEVRDSETAQIAIQASLTGHLVLSTLHTNDAASAVTRLLDMGVEPYLISSSVIAVVAQRLLRMVCQHCRVPLKWDPHSVAVAGEPLKAPESDIFYRAKGCEKCRFTGYQGRIAIYEILPFTFAIKQQALKKASANEIRVIAEKEGMKTLFEAGWEKVCQGLTTPEEFLRVVQAAH